MNDQVKLPALGEFVPGAAERERRASHFGETEDDAVKMPGSFHIGDTDSDVMQRLDFNHGFLPYGASHRAR
jgi:hypothetical protein